MEQSSKTLYVGLDVHKEFIAVAYAPEDRGAVEPPLVTACPPRGGSDTRCRPSREKRGRVVATRPRDTCRPGA